MKKIELPENGDAVLLRMGTKEWGLIIIDDDYPAEFVGGDIFSAWNVMTDLDDRPKRIMWLNNQWEEI